MLSDHSERSLMNSPGNLSVNSSRSSVCLMDEHDRAQSIEQNYQACQELIQQNLVDEKRIKEDIEEEDKKCNLLKYAVETMKKQCFDAEQITMDLRKCVFSTQMEIEKIGMEILEQKTAIENKFPGDGWQYFTEMVNVTAYMVEHIKHLQMSLATNVEECARHDNELGQQRDSVIQLLENIDQLKTANRENRRQLKSINQTCTVQSSKDLVNLEENTNLLIAEFKKYETLKSQVAALQVEEGDLKERKEEILRNCEKIEENTREVTRKYSEVNSVYQTQWNSLRKHEIAIEKDYFKMVQQLDSEFSRVDQLIRNLNQEVCDKESHVKILATRNIQLQKDVENISEQERKLLQKEEAMKMEIGSKETGLVDEYALRTQYEQIHLILEAEISNNQGKLDDLATELERLKIENDVCQSSVNGKPDEDTLMKIYQEKQSIINNTSISIGQMESEKIQLQMIMEKMTHEQELLECNTSMCTVQYAALESVWENMKHEVDARSVEIDRLLNEYTESMNKSSTDCYEKQLLIDSLREDLQEYANKHIATLHEIWLVTRENDNKKAELDHINEKLLIEQVEYTNSKTLLQELQKNTLPTDEIPEKWFQSFEKQKKEFHTLFKDRVKLEKERNIMIIEMDTYGFQKSQSQELPQNVQPDNEPNKPENSKNAKDVYNAFKDRLKRNDLTVATTKKLKTTLKV